MKNSIPGQCPKPLYQFDTNTQGPFCPTIHARIEPIGSDGFFFQVVGDLTGTINGNGQLGAAWSNLHFFPINYPQDASEMYTAQGKRCPHWALNQYLTLRQWGPLNRFSPKWVVKWHIKGQGVIPENWAPAEAAEITKTAITRGHREQ